MANNSQQQKPHRSFLDNLRAKPEKTRKKILWGSVAIIAILLIYLWVLQLKVNTSKIDFQNLSKPPVATEGNIKEDVNSLVNELKNISSQSKEELERLNKNLEELKEVAPAEQQ